MNVKVVFYLLLFIFLSLPTGRISAAEIVYILNGAVTDNPAGISQYDDLKVLELATDYYNRYTDAANGYSLLVPSGMRADISLSPVVTVFANDVMTIEVYYDNFADTTSNTGEYIGYGNNFIHNSKYHTLLANKTHYINGYNVHLLKWERQNLKMVPNDKKYYASLAFIIDRNNVYTVNIKSTQSISADLEQNIMTGFKKIPRQGIARFSKKFAHSDTPLNEETKKFYGKYFGGQSGLNWGIFEMSAPLDYEILDRIEGELDYNFPILVYYHTFDDYFPVRALEKARERGRYLEVTLQTFHREKDGADNAGVIYEILDGKYDEYFREYAAWMKRFNYPVLFRLNNEMNGEWCFYSAYHYGKDAELYRILWRYVHDIFRQEGVDNVLWVFNPNDGSFPPFSWNHYLNYYPGDEYVDIIGLTGYNTGTYYPGEKWRSFSEIYIPLYRDYERHFNKPFMIGEFGSNSVGGDKAAWIEEMFREIEKFPKIKIAVWWNGIDYNSQGQPARVYRLDETPQVQEAFREGLSQFKKTKLPPPKKQ